MKNDPTITQLNGLSPTARSYAVYIINLFRSAGIPMGIVNLGGRRTPEEQSRLVGSGLSATKNSAHLTGDAFDLDVLGVSRDDLPQEYWTVLGSIVEQLGLVWGGRWQHPYDPGHVELPKHLRMA